MATESAILATITVAGESYRVLRYTLREALSSVSSLGCEIVKDDHAPPDPAKLVGKPAELTLERTDDHQKRIFVGIVASAERGHTGDDVQHVKLSVVPRLWYLGKRADCRIFQKMSVPDIVKKVLTGCQVPADHQDWKIKATYAKRDYTVQYRETDLDFVQRLLAEEGIWFAIEMKDGKDIVVFADDGAGLGPAEDAASLAYVDEHGFERTTNNVFRVRQECQVKSDKVMLRDYDAEHPKLKLEAKAEGTDPGSHALEVYRYPGRFKEKPAGEHFTKMLLESMQAERDIVRGDAGVVTLAPGRSFAIEEHPYAVLNQNYLIIGLEISGSEARQFEVGGAGQAPARFSYTCSFSAVPTKKTKYRPARIDRERFIPGVQTAVTTGPSGEEIYTDKSGHVKAQFHWDRHGKNDESSSRWMRTSQLPTGGSMLLPRMGWEVAIRHREGDCDQPIVMGRMYNGLTMPPYALPAGKARGSVQTATTPGGGSSNEFRMDDTKGKEEMFFNASKDMSIDVKNNTTESVGNNQTRTIGSNHKVNVTNSVTAAVGANQKVTVGGNQTVHVSTFKVDQVTGDHSLTIGGNRTMMIGGDYKREVVGDSKLTVNGISIDLVVGSVSEETLASHTHKVGAALVELTAADRSVMVGGARDEKTGAAKIIATKGGRGVEVGGAMSQKVAGAILTKIGGDRADTAGGKFTSIAAGAHIIKADKMVFEADDLLSWVMGASTITMTPNSITIAGTGIKLDGAVGETAAMVIDN